jgi:hypothetical protein
MIIQTNQKKIAKEILLLFSCTLLIGLIWVTFWLKNNYTINKVASLQNQVEVLTAKIDSIHSSFPKVIPFDSLVIWEDFGQPLIDKNYIPMPQEVFGSELDKTRTENIRKLYRVLILQDFAFPQESFVSNHANLLPEVKFTENIEKELREVNGEKTILNKIYTFLRSKSNVKVNSEQFFFNIEGLPLPPKYDSWMQYEKYKLEKNELVGKIKETKTHIYSSNSLGEVIKFTSIIILLIVYPLRLVYFILKWSLRTLWQQTP